MAHIALVCPPLRGHLDPTMTLARALAARGHRATLISGDAAVPLAGGEVAVIDPRLPERARLLERQAGRAGPLATISGMAERCEALCETLPGLFRALGVDHVIVDQTEPAGALAALSCRIPYSSLACALPLDRERGLPPPFVDWAYRADGSRQWLYDGGHRVTDWLLRPLSRVIARRAKLWCIPGVTALADTFSRDLQLFQIVRSLDFPRRSPPQNAHWVGPLREETMASFSPADDQRPIAFCSLGTLQGFRGDLFAAMASSLAACGLRPVIVHGGQLPAEEGRLLSGSPLVADFLPQRAVLARARLAILHGGMNSVLDALAAGVPLVVIPLAYEQGAIAARVEASGAGIVVPRRKVRAGLPSACRALLEDPTFAENAARMGKDIAAAGGVTRAVELVESRLGAQQGRRQFSLGP